MAAQPRGARAEAVEPAAEYRKGTPAANSGTAKKDVAAEERGMSPSRQRRTTKEKGNATVTT